ncbi:thioredoxin family protein [Haloferula sp.]|uniref:thioredoxin family protein n=1 Tax=Haloferula sp. TaxID=2497595 RepID=UPI00329CEAC0
MKTLAITALAATLSLGTAFAGGEGWINDFEAAKKQAADEKKDLLIDFTGSDWCGWCIKLNDEVFKHDEFKTGVKDKYVLVELDFPQDKSKVSEETQKQNADLQQKYAVQGFPTILLADAEGKPFAKTGYQKGGPEAYLTHLGELQQAKATRDEAFKSASSAEGVDKAKALVDALKAMALEDATVSAFYGDLVDQIKEADPKDETGFVKEIETKQKFAEFETQLNQFGQQQDHDGAMKLVTETLAKDEFQGEQKQQITLIKAMILAEQKQFDESLKTLDTAKEIAPDSSIGGRIGSFKEHITKMKAEAEAASDEPTTEAKKEGE